MNDVGGAGLRIENLTVAYDRHPAIHHISATIEPGSLTAVVGPNGAGKSTLVKSIACVVRPLEGRVRRSPPGAPLAYLPQQAEIDRAFPITVADAVLLGRWSRIGWHRAARGGDRDAVAAALEAVGLSSFERRIVGTLSVGQFQRMLFARLMLQDAALIVLDEPFAALDTRTVDDLVGVLLRWHAEGRTILVVLHDLVQVEKYIPQTLLLARELVAFGPTPEVLAPSWLAAARRMAEAWDEDAESCALGLETVG